METLKGGNNIFLNVRGLHYACMYLHTFSFDIQEMLQFHQNFDICLPFYGESVPGAEPLCSLI